MIAVSVNEPGVDENTWEEVAPTRVIADNFSETRTYVENELAVYGGKLYRAKALTVAAVWDASKWEAIGGGVVSRSLAPTGPQAVSTNRAIPSFGTASCCTA